MKKLCILSAFTITLALFGCSAPARSPGQEFQVDELRRTARVSGDTEVLERWLLAELIMPGGAAKPAQEAKQALERAPHHSMLGELALGLDATFHGQLDRAPDYYLAALRAARDSRDPRAPFVAWFAASQATQLRHNAPQLWQRWQRFVHETLAEPRNIGFRAREELVGWWRLEAHAATEQGVEDRIAKAHGCIDQLSLAGPFGHNSPQDLDRHFPAEEPGPWPVSWPADPVEGEDPHVLKTRLLGCSVSTDEPVAPGLFYAQSFVELAAPSPLLLAVRGAVRLWVDDQLVLSRDPREWGAWIKLGVQVTLGAGRHRILAEVSEPRTSLRVMHVDGQPLTLKASTDGAQPYSLVKPQSLPGANIWDGIVKEGQLVAPEDPLLNFLGAHLAGLEGQADVGTVLLEPLLKPPARATGPVLSTAALLTTSDPVFALNQRRDLVRELEEQAVERDPMLWRSQLALAMWEGEKAGLPEGARRLEALVDRFPKVPDLLRELSSIYKDLEWSSQYLATIRKLTQNFPQDPRALALGVLVHDALGEAERADQLAKKVAELDPDSELQLSRALNRQDYDAALVELRRISARRPDRRDIIERIHDVMLRSGNTEQQWKKLETTLKHDPHNERARLTLADARFANGQKSALVQALADAVVAGSTTGQIEQALDLVEGMSDLEPYRVKAEPLIAAYEKSGVSLSGTAVRVLDSAVVWVHADGSSRMLEHELIRVQSAEAITSMAEQPLRNGLFLHLRVIKKDGRTLEPELVEGKPTVTMPHLEVGDYIEIERLESNRSVGGRRGKHYIGPRWFFREEKIPYVRSEINVISPKNKPLLIETLNDVPAAQETDLGPFTLRRWRVEKSAAAPQEPFSAPITETLPSLQFGWGLSLDTNLRKLSESVADLAPIDPRIRRVAERIVEGVPPSEQTERGRRLYRWVVENIQNGEENDGRRVILGKNGNVWRGYQMLCRALGMRIDYVVAQNRLTLPPTGPFSAALLYTQPAFRLHTEKGDQWLTFAGRYVPFGYVPAELRGMPAFALNSTPPEPTRIPEGGSPDMLRYSGNVRLALDGTAELDLAQTFFGRYAMSLRDALAEIPEDQMRNVLESRLLGADLRGIQLDSFHIEQAKEVDKPLVLKFRAKMSGFAQQNGRELSIFPPFSPRLTQIAALPIRQTPLLMVDAMERQIDVVIELPSGARMEETLASAVFNNGERRVETRDTLDLSKGRLNLKRSVTLPAGRIPVSEYPEFARFAQRAEEAMLKTIRVRFDPP